MLYAIVAVLALILDQAVKYWTTVHIVVDTGDKNLIPGFIHLVNVHNTGAAFSVLEGARWFFVILCIIFVLIVVYALVKELITHPVCRWTAVIVMAGAIGNCIDRIVCGYVVDMLEFEFRIFHRPFPVFNIADIYITIGVIVFCVALLLEKPSGKASYNRKITPATGDASGTAGETPARETPAPKAERKPLIRKRQKIEIPVFEKRERPAEPVMDPNDPFAEWEKRTAQPEPAPAPEPPAPTATVYTQPEPAAPAAPAAPATPAAPVVEPVPVTPAAPVAPAAPAAPAPAPAPKADEFDLDSILAEFKDL